MITRPTCQSCKYYQKPNMNGPIDLRQMPPGECHFGPVTVHVVPMPQPGGQGFGLQNISVWPPIHGHQWCGRHQDFEKQFAAPAEEDAA